MIFIWPKIHCNDSHQRSSQADSSWAHAISLSARQLADWLTDWECCASIAKDLFRFLSQSSDRRVYYTAQVPRWVYMGLHRTYRCVINCLDSDILCWMWHITYIYKVVLLIHSWMLHSRWLNCIGAPNKNVSNESTSVALQWVPAVSNSTALCLVRIRKFE